MRLKLGPEDGYAWSVIDLKAHLMKMGLSSGLVGLYDVIYKEISRLIEAVRPALAGGDSSRSDIGYL